MISNQENPKHTFGAELKKIRLAHGIKAFELAEKIGVHQTYVTHIEKRGKIPSPEVFDKIKQVFGENLFLNELYKLALESKNSLSPEKAQNTTLRDLIALSIATLVQNNEAVSEKQIRDLFLAFKLLSPKSSKEEATIKSTLREIEKLASEYKYIHYKISKITDRLMKLTGAEILHEKKPH